jgi:hypothetical protein
MIHFAFKIVAFFIVLYMALSCYFDEDIRSSDDDRSSVMGPPDPEPAPKKKPLWPLAFYLIPIAYIVFN